MPSNDSEVFNNLERALSGDLDDAQSLAARVLANLCGFYGQSGRVLGVASDVVRNVVVGGLTVSPSGVNVQVAPGVLGQNSAILAPAPGPLDSTYRFARNDVGTVVNMPALGVLTYYLLEAQMVEQITVSTPRDIYNPVTQTFTPAVVTKQVAHRIQFQLTPGAGTNAPAPTGGDWVPIAIIRRPAGGPAVLATDIIDVRPVAEWGRERPLQPQVVAGSLSVPAGAATNNAMIQAAMDGPNGRMVINAPVAAFDLTSAIVQSPTTVYVANTWYFVYLCAWSVAKLRPVLSGGAAFSTQGVFVVSAVPPSATPIRVASANVDLPPPFGVTQCQGQDAYLVGAVRRNAANTGFAAIESTDLKHFDYLGGTTDTATVRAAFVPANGANNTTPAANSVPANVPRFTIAIGWTGATAWGAGPPPVDAQIVIFVCEQGGPPFNFRSSIVLSDTTTGGDPSSRHEAIVPAGSYGTPNFDLHVFIGVPSGTATLTLVAFDLP